MIWKNLLRNNVIYAIGSLANSAALLLLIPFLVNHLPTSEYGAWSIFEVAVLLLRTMMALGIDVAMMREYFFLEATDQKKLIGTVLIAISIWSVLIASLFFLAYSNIHTYLPPEFRSITSLIIFGISLSELLFTVALSVFRIREQPVPFVLLSVGRMILFLLCTVSGIQVIGGVDGALFGRLISGVVAMAVALLLIYKKVSWVFDKRLLSKVLSYGIPLLPAGLSSYVLLSSDRYIIGFFASLEAVAVYSFAYKVASSVDILIIRPFATDWAARLFRIAKGHNAPENFANMFIVYLTATTVGVLGVFSLAPLIFRWLAPNTYMYGLKLLPLLSIGVQIYGMSYLLNIGMMLKERSKYLALIGIAAATFCLVIELLMIPSFGIVGAAWSTVLSYLFWIGAMAYFSQKFYPVPHKTGKIMTIACCELLGFAGILLIDQLLPVSFALNIMLALAWCLIIYAGLVWLNKENFSILLAEK